MDNSLNFGIGGGLANYVGILESQDLSGLCLGLGSLSDQGSPLGGLIADGGVALPDDDLDIRVVGGGGFNEANRTINQVSCGRSGDHVTGDFQRGEDRGWRGNYDADDGL
jgi:hypothetical protein